MATMKNTIESKARDALNPLYIEVIDESHGHNVPEGAESHFKLVIVSESFVGVRAVKRHQQLYALLQQELEGSVHALALHLYAPDEWEGEVPASPNCMGGSAAS